jgi:hypothetical protein
MNDVLQQLYDGGNTMGAPGNRIVVLTVGASAGHRWNRKKKLQGIKALGECALEINYWVE